jgi:adenylate cyclase
LPEPEQEKTVKIVYPIGAKLVTIITILLLLSLGIITFLVSYMVSSDVQITAEDNNFNVNKRTAAQVEADLNTIRSNTLALLDTLNAAASSPAISSQAAAFFFERNQNIAAIAAAGNSIPLINTRFFQSNEIERSAVENFLAGLGETHASETDILNATPAFGVPVLAIFLPWQSAEAVVFFSSDFLSDAFGSGANSSFMINGRGDILAHPDAELVQAGINASSFPIVDITLRSKEKNMQVLYTDRNGIQQFGAFQKLTLSAAVITTVEYDIVFEGVAATTRRNILLTGMVLFLSILFIWFFSKTISGPLRRLTDAARQIEEGNFNLELVVKNKDEVGVLTQSFVRMSRGLAERERLRETFGRFTNTEIAERAMRGELKLGGESKRVTIFFSDIRSFTAISETMSPHDVVEFLNRYMTRMVKCVEKTGGIVDKFIGDAVMAVWGAHASAGSVARDAYNCVRSALLMRSSLREYNKTRGTPKRPIIKIGCGINTGEVVAGQIGSESRMEYTVIGDAVNLASRTEALNKPLGTDILITENTWNLIGKYFITEEMPPVTVKGKKKPIRMFAVINIVVKDGAAKTGPQTLSELRALLGIKAPDLNKVDLEAPEQKYSIGTE